MAAAQVTSISQHVGRRNHPSAADAACGDMAPRVGEGALGFLGGGEGQARDGHGRGEGGRKREVVVVNGMEWNGRGGDEAEKVEPVGAAAWPSYGYCEIGRLPCGGADLDASGGQAGWAAGRVGPTRRSRYGNGSKPFFFFPLLELSVWLLFSPSDRTKLFFGWVNARRPFENYKGMESFLFFLATATKE